MASESESQKTIIPAQMSFDGGGYNRDEILVEIRQMVDRSALLLSGLSPEHERLGWLLQDTLTFLDELETKVAVDKAFPEISLSLEDQVKVINSKR